MDGNHNRLVLFGGYGETQDEYGTLITYLNDSWALNLGGTPTWQSLSPAGLLSPERDRANGAIPAPGRASSSDAALTLLWASWHPP